MRVYNEKICGDGPAPVGKKRYTQGRHVMDWHYTQPVTIHFGSGKIACLGDEIRKTGKKRGLLVTSPFFGANGLADKLMAESGGMLCATYRQVAPNPDIRECDTCIRLIHENACDFVVALGGGSVMDCAKSAAAFSTAGHPCIAYLDKTIAPPTQSLPLIAIPTTAGTGSEVTRVAVLSDHSQGRKVPLSSPAFYPVCAIVDPDLTRTAPAHLTACAGMDVLCHAIEAYWSIRHQPVCDALAIHAARLVLQYLEAAWENPNDPLAREKMAEASVTAGLAFAQPGTTGAHACSYPLTSLLGIPHGEACGLTIDHFMRINAKADTDGRLALLAQATGFSDIANMADAIAELKYRTGLKTDLASYNLSDDQLEKIVAASQSPILKNNPVPISGDMLRTLYDNLR